MKKFLVAAGVAVAALGFTSCNGGSSSTGEGAGNDSLSILLGEVQGATYQGYWDQMPDTMKAKLSKDDFIAGLKSVLSRDAKKDQSYLMGVGTGMQLINNIAQLQDADVKFDANVFIKHFAESFKKDSIDQKEIMLLNQQLQVEMTKANEKMVAKREADLQRQRQEAEAAAAPNIKAGKEYVEAQKKADPAIKTLESGVSYKVVKEGAGQKPGKSDNVNVIYTGKHINGEVFDSSNGEPRQFNVRGVVPGFGEILQLMAPGEKVVAYIPADQAYGNTGSGQIKPGETLVFEIELVDVAAAPKAPKPLQSK